jgi:hypothetical protein
MCRLIPSKSPLPSKTRNAIQNLLVNNPLRLLLLLLLLLLLFHG